MDRILTNYFNNNQIDIYKTCSIYKKPYLTTDIIKQFKFIYFPIFPPNLYRLKTLSDKYNFKIYTIYESTRDTQDLYILKGFTTSCLYFDNSSISKNKISSHLIFKNCLISFADPSIANKYFGSNNIYKMNDNFYKYFLIYTYPVDTIVENIKEFYAFYKSVNLADFSYEGPYNVEMLDNNSFII